MNKPAPSKPLGKTACSETLAKRLSFSGVTPQELALLDAASRNAEKTIEEVNAMLEATNRRADQVFAELERMRGAASDRSAPEPTPLPAAAASGGEAPTARPR